MLTERAMSTDKGRMQRGNAVLQKPLCRRLYCRLKHHNSTF